MTIFGFTLSAAIIWLILAIVFGIVEAATMGLTTIWFTGGAIIASIMAMAGFSLLVQIITFIVVSTLLIYFTRPFAKRKLNVSTEKTNADALIGKEAIVTETILPLSVGQAKVDGLMWSAAAEDKHLTIEKDSLVTIVNIEGVKLIVIPSPE